MTLEQKSNVRCFIDLKILELITILGVNFEDQVLKLGMSVEGSSS